MIKKKLLFRLLRSIWGQRSVTIIPVRFKLLIKKHGGVWVTLLYYNNIHSSTRHLTTTRFIQYSEYIIKDAKCILRPSIEFSMILRDYSFKYTDVQFVKVSCIDIHLKISPIQACLKMSYTGIK